MDNKEIEKSPKKVIKELYHFEITDDNESDDCDLDWTDVLDLMNQFAFQFLKQQTPVSIPTKSPSLVSEIDLEAMALKKYPVDIQMKDAGGATEDVNRSDRFTYKQGLRDAFSTLLVKEGEKDSEDWISVSEKLPENEGEYVLVANKNGIHYSIHIYRNKLWYGYGNAYHTNEITHWMPLPSPPKTEN